MVLTVTGYMYHNNECQRCKISLCLSHVLKNLFYYCYMVKTSIDLYLRMSFIVLGERTCMYVKFISCTDLLLSGCLEENV